VKISAEQLSNKVDVLERGNEDVAKTDDILVFQVLEQLEFAVGSFGEDGCAERFHDLLDRDGLPGKLILRGAVRFMVSALS
jgi:hypothetical protein